MTEHLAAIRSRGFWTVLIRPAKYNQSRVENITSLFDIILRNAVTLRGWDFPHIDQRQFPIYGNRHVEQSTEWENNLEFWRAYQSGQFIYFGGLQYDWFDKASRYTKPARWPDVPFIGVLDSLFRVSEFYEFAARLTSSPMGDEAMEVSITLDGLRNRRLWVEAPGRAGFPIDYEAALDSWTQSHVHSAVELLANSRELALNATRELFRRFGWDAPLEVLRGMQDELRWPQNG